MDDGGHGTEAAGVAEDGTGDGAAGGASARTAPGAGPGSTRDGEAGGEAGGEALAKPDSAVIRDALGVGIAVGLSVSPSA